MADSSPSLNIALAAIEYPPDPISAGIGSYTKALASGLMERGHTVHVVTRGNRDAVSDEDGVIVHRLTPARPELPDKLSAGNILRMAAKSLIDEWRYRQRVANRLTELVQTRGVDVIEAADHMAEAIFYNPRRFPQVPLIIRLHTPLAYSERIDPNIPEVMRQGVRFIETRFLKRASHLTAPSGVCADIFRQEMKLGNQPITVFPNPPTYPLEPKTITGNENPNLVLFVGRVTKWKGADLLIRAIPEVLAQHPEARFILVGRDNIATEGFSSVSDYLYSILPTASYEHVTFTGHKSHEEVASYYQQAAVCVFPSRFEAFGYTCLEAMTYGKAIVGSRNGGMMEMLEHGEAGLLYTPPDVNELANNILRLLKDKALRRNLGEKAKRRVLSCYSKEQVLTEIEGFYYRALEEL